MKLFYGNSSALGYIPQDFKIYNFSSLKEIGIPMNLFPPNNLGAINEYDFDCKYAQYIMCNDFVFCSLMNFIMDLYSNQNIFILISDESDSFFNPDVGSWSAMLIESFLKFIQQRYGLNATYIESSDDINISEDAEFSDFGIFNLDEDKERWSYIVEYNRILNGGTPYG